MCTPPILAARSLALALGFALPWPAGLAQQNPAASSSAPDLSQLDLEHLMPIEVRQVHGASKREQSTLEAFSSVSIITGEEFRVRQYGTLDEVLASLCGVYSTGDRTYRHTGVRGFSVPGDFNSRRRMLVDGHRLNESI